MEFPKKYNHLILEGVSETKPYRPVPGGGTERPLKKVNPDEHGKKLKHQIGMLQREIENLEEFSFQSEVKSNLGIQVKFESFPEFQLKSDSLARERSGIELLGVRHDAEGNESEATVFIPADKLNHLEKLVDDYNNEDKITPKGFRKHKPLIETIANIQKACLEDLWTDDPEAFPSSTKDPIWWEVWLHTNRDHEKVRGQFLKQIKVLDMEAAVGNLVFPERVVVLIRTSKEKLENSMKLLANMAELRSPKTLDGSFEDFPLEEQNAWFEQLLKRTQYPSGTLVPYICLLDTGVNRGHKLLEPVLSAADMYTIQPDWGVDDAAGHGTRMAGLALFGNLAEALHNQGVIKIEHCLESVKLLEPSRTSAANPEIYGYRTQQAVLDPESTNSDRLRVFGMAITTQDGRDRGRPSAWSAKLDSLAVNVDQDKSNPRLLIVSAGNTDRDSWSQYPASNDTDEVHDPAQSWNALTVGACTNLTKITEQDAGDLNPIAPEGGLSPFSTTSLSWENSRPFKPDVVFEGGNAALDSQKAPWTLSSLNLLTTHHKPTERTFASINATSAATALASRFAAQILTVYPKLWPETVRALIVHSAEWTSAMEKCLPLSNKLSEKEKFRILLRRCGFGVPNLDQALWTFENSLTMVVQESLQPFKKQRGRSPTLGSMQIHDLPWPRDALESIGETTVEMRVTLSYFIEPNPSRRGSSSLYCYPSHGLQFDIKRPRETQNSFEKRVNLDARNKPGPHSTNDADPKWKIGIKNRHRGSIHGDIWSGSAADLASRECIAVYPVSGWWKTRPKHKKYNETARYALIVSIKAPKTNVNLYTEVKNRISVPTKVII